MESNIASEQAQKQWNTNPCGAVEGDQESLEYFVKVEEERYIEQSWQKSFFQYKKFNNLKVLEIGIGHGTDLLQFAAAGARCYGIDITDKHLELTNRNFELRNLKVELVKGSAASMPFEDNEFDCVYSFGVLHHIPDVENVMQEIHRVLKPGGKVMIALYNKWSAAFLCRTILIDGLVRGNLFRLGYQGLLSTIESGADGINIKPYVKMYSKKTTRNLLENFQVINISVNQLKPHHIHSIFKKSKIMTYLARKLDGRLGWYVSGIGVRQD